MKVEFRGSLERQAHKGQAVNLEPLVPVDIQERPQSLGSAATQVYLGVAVSVAHIQDSQVLLVWDYLAIADRQGVRVLPLYLSIQ